MAQAILAQGAGAARTAESCFLHINNIEPNLVSDDIDSNAKIDGKENIELTLPGKETIEASNNIESNVELTSPGKENSEAINNIEIDRMRDDIDFNVEASNSIKIDLMREGIDSKAEPLIWTPQEPVTPTSAPLAAVALSGTPTPNSSHNTGADDFVCTVCVTLELPGTDAAHVQSSRTTRSRKRTVPN